MQNIHVSRYRNPDQVGWAGTIEPEDRSWILFIPADRKPPSLFLHRKIPPSEAVQRGLEPHDPVTNRGVNGEYIAASEWGYDASPEPNPPVIE